MGIFSSIFGGKAQKDAARSNLKESKSAQKDSLGYVEPFAAAGKDALTDYLNGLGLGDSNAAIAKFQASPEYMLNYQTALDEGTKGVGAVAQGTGTFNSGRTLKALQDRAQTTSRGFYSDFLKGVSGVADMGYSAAGAKANIRTGGSANIQAANTGIANAKTAQYAGFDQLLNTGIKLAGTFMGVPPVPKLY